jgi:hypothetical protein
MEETEKTACDRWTRCFKEEAGPRERLRGGVVYGGCKPIDLAS